MSAAGATFAGSGTTSVVTPPLFRGAGGTFRVRATATDRFGHPVAATARAR